MQDMYRYGDGTPFPLDENFIDTLTTAVETCTNNGATIRAHTSE